jgi:hypothetical protein
VLAALAVPAGAAAQPEVIRDEVGEQVRIYKTPEERREAGLKYHITPWLALSGLVEFEYLYQRYSSYDTTGHASDDDFSKALQVAMELTPWPSVKGELIYEYDDEANRHTLDEAIAAFEAGDWELAVGKQYLPFGVYFSHFVRGPLLEFGETRDRGATLSYGTDERVDLSAFAYKGRARKVDSDDGRWGWGLAAELSPFPFGSFGVSYLSDLADSQDGLLSDENDRYESRVGGLSAYAIIGFEGFEVTAEFARALSAFQGLEPDRNKPRAWNVELAFYPRGNFEWALRLEGSNELDGAPHLRGGVALAWRVMRNASLTLEYLRGKFRRGLGEDNNEQALDAINQVGGQITIDF